MLQAKDVNINVTLHDKSQQKLIKLFILLHQNKIMKLIEILLNDAIECRIGGLNRKLTVILKNGDKIIVHGKEIVRNLFYMINGK
jgi:hypothetical protein